MTRGFVVLIRDNQIVKVGYSNSDSYFSGLGLELLKAYKAGNVESFIENDLEINFLNKDKFSKTWYDKDAYIKKYGVDDGFFEDYTYILDSSKNKLTIYSFGKKKISFDMKDIETLCYLFENENNIREGLGYDFNLLTINYESFYPKLKELLQSGNFVIPVLEKYKVIGDNIKLILETGHCVDVWHTPTSPAYKWGLTICDENKYYYITYICNKRYNEWTLSVQYPYLRHSILYGFKSENKAKEGLINYIKCNLENLILFAKMSNHYQEMTIKIKAALDENINFTFPNDCFDDFPNNEDKKEFIKFLFNEYQIYKDKLSEAS